ncbi:MAG: hypothetical protein AAF975_03440 [Spirochaetota bacterium]
MLNGAGIYANAVLSAVANIMHGGEHQQELQRVSGFLWQMIPYVFSFAVPLMVIFLAEVLSRQESELEKEMAREEKKAARAAGESGGRSGGQEPVKTGRLTKTERSDKVVEAVVEGKRSRSEIAEYTGFPKSSVNDLLNELYRSGRLIKNEGGQPELPDSDQYRPENGLEMINNYQEVGV